MRTEEEIKKKIKEITDYVLANKKNMREYQLATHRYRILDLQWVLGKQGIRNDIYEINKEDKKGY